MGDVRVTGWPVAPAASDGASGGGAVIGPHRGRRARRRPLPASSIRPPCPTPCHATAGAAPVLHQWTIPSSSTPSATRRGTHGRRACATLLVRALPRAGAGVQPLRPGPDLLRHGLCSGGSLAVAALRRPALSVQPTRALNARRENSALARTPSVAGRTAGGLGAGDTAIGDASGFPVTGLGCCTDRRPHTRDRRCCTCRIGATRPAMRDPHHQRRILARCHLAPYRIGVVLSLVPHALFGTRAAGFPAPQPLSTVQAPYQRTGGTQPWP